MQVPYELSLSQKIFTSSYYAFNALNNPERGDLVAALGDVTGFKAGQNLVKRMKLSENGRYLLKNKPIISKNTLNFNSLQNFPEGSLGKSYYEYMIEYNFDTDERPTVQFIQDPNVAYAILRYRQVHDFWHILCDLPPSLLGEIALKWFEWRHTGLPSCAMSALVGPIKLSTSDRYTLKQRYIPWANEAATTCQDLLSVHYEENLDKQVNDLRNELNLKVIRV